MGDDFEIVGGGMGRGCWNPFTDYVSCQFAEIFSKKTTIHLIQVF